MKALLAKLERHVALLKEQDLVRVLKPKLGHDFCSNDYLGLAKHQQIIEAVRLSAAHGYGSTSSRFVRGEDPRYQEVQEQFARLLGYDAALLFSSGYMANIGALSSLVGKGDIVFSDQLNHASIIDGLRLSGAVIQVFQHRDVDQLKKLIGNTQKNVQKFLVTESLFSMDGDIAPLDIYADLAQQHDIALIVDESHAVGIYGQHGAGLVKHFGIENHVLVSVNGLGKAFGCYGGIVAGQQVAIDFLTQKARSLMFTTALPPLAIAAINEALPLVAEGSLQKKLFVNIDYFSDQLKALGLMNPHQTSSPIIPLIVGENQRALIVAKNLNDAGFDVRAIRPPTVPKHTARLRITINVSHTQELMDGICGVLAGAHDSWGYRHR